MKATAELRALLDVPYLALSESEEDAPFVFNIQFPRKQVCSVDGSYDLWLDGQPKKFGASKEEALAYLGVAAC